MSLQSSIIANLASVQADMNYLAPMLERPRNYTFEPPPGVPRSNTVNEAHRVPIHDARPVADRVSLDANGFALVNHRSAVRDFFDDEEVRRVYYPEVERVVKQATGAVPRPHLRPYDAPARRGRAGSQRCAAPAGAARAHRPHRALGPAARARPVARRGRRAPEGPRAGDQPVAPDQGTGAGFAARGVRRHDHRSCRPGAVGSRLSASRRRDLFGEVQSRAPLVLRAAHAARRGAAAEVLGHQDRRAGALHAAQRLHRSDDASRRPAAREHRGEDAGVPPHEPSVPHRHDLRCGRTSAIREVTQAVRGRGRCCG